MKSMLRCLFVAVLFLLPVSSTLLAGADRPYCPDCGNPIPGGGPHTNPPPCDPATDPTCSGTSSPTQPPAPASQSLLSGLLGLLSGLLR